MSGEVIELGMGIEAACRWHHIDGGASEIARLPSRFRSSVDCGAPATESHEAHDTRSKPRTQPLHPGEPSAVLVDGEFVCPRCGPLHQIGHPDTVGSERRAWISVDRHQTCCQCCWPEAVTGSSEADPGAGGVGAGIEAADEHLHVGTDDVGQRGCSTERDFVVWPARGVVGDPCLDGEACTDEHTTQIRFRPMGVLSAAELIALGRLEIEITAEHHELSRCVIGECSVQFGQRQRQPTSGNMNVDRGDQGCADRSSAKRKRAGLAADPGCGRHPSAEDLQERLDRFEGDDRFGQALGEIPGASTNVEERSCRVGAGSIDETKGCIDVLARPSGCPRRRMLLVECCGLRVESNDRIVGRATRSVSGPVSRRPSGLGCAA